MTGWLVSSPFWRCPQLQPLSARDILERRNRGESTGQAALSHGQREVGKHAARTDGQLDTAGRESVQDLADAIHQVDLATRDVAIIRLFEIGVALQVGVTDGI